MVQVIWTRKAITQLGAIRELIASGPEQDSERHAMLFCTRLARGTRHLKEFPRSGHVAPEFSDENIRELPIYPYRILCQLAENRCYVVAVIDGDPYLLRHEDQTQ